MANKNSNSGCAIIIIGFIIGTIIFGAIFTDKVWDRVLNAPVSSMAATNSIYLWLVLCIPPTKYIFYSITYLVSFAIK